MSEQQSLKKTAAAFVAGAVITAAAASLLVGAFASEEPPIRVRPGSIDLDLPTSKKWQEKQANWWQIKNGEKTATSYEILISTTVPDRCPKGLEKTTATIKVVDSGGNWFLLEIVGRRTKVTSSNASLVSLSGDKEVLTLTPGDYIKEIIGDSGNGIICTFERDEFVGATIY